MISMTTKSPKSFFPTGPVECQFCGIARTAEDTISLFSWVIFKPCGCPGAVASREAYEAEEARRKGEEQERNRRESVVRIFSEIPQHFQDRTFDSFVVNDDNRAAYNLARAYPAKEGKQSIMMAGKPGTGKTHLAAAVAIGQALQQKSVIFGTVPTILGRIKDTFSGGDVTESEVKSAIMNCSLLVLDDLGKEKPSEWVEETLYEIINARYVRRLPVIITTNVGLKAVESRYQWNGAAIVSRLFEMCAGVRVEGEDYRRRKC
jgi:DNA replication protein DnaC